LTRDSSKTSGYSSAFSIVLKNGGKTELKNFEVKEEIPAEVIGDFIGADANMYKKVVWNPLPARIEKGSVVAVWLVPALKPGEAAVFSYAVDKNVGADVLSKFKPLTVVKSGAEAKPESSTKIAGEAAAIPEKQNAPLEELQFSPKKEVPGWILVLIAAVILVVGILGYLYLSGNLKAFAK